MLAHSLLDPDSNRAVTSSRPKGIHVALATVSQLEYTLELANALARDVRVTLFLFKRRVGLSVGASEDMQGSMRRQGLLSADVELVLLPSWRVRDPRNVRAILQMRHEIAARSPDVVHITQGGGGDLWMAIAGLFVRAYPFVVTLMDAQAHPGDSPAPWIWRLTNAMAIRLSDRIIVNGRGLGQQMQDNYKIATSKMEYTPMGPFEVFCRYSTGRNRERPNAKVAQLFEEAAVVVMPYIEASTSGVLATAYAFGKPTITTRVGCLPEIVLDGITGR